MNLPMTPLPNHPLLLDAEAVAERLPDGEIRFARTAIEALVRGTPGGANGLVEATNGQA
ncbi:MAG: hypothetical protein GY842_13820 [bacterium]|nr:hypothetical protein [bacterium]